MSTKADTDWRGWLARWDAQQQRHIPDREERFTAIIDALETFAGSSPRVLDLGCGPGSLSARVLRRIPGATVVAVDADPVLLAIGRGALGEHANLTFVDADLRAGWTGSIPPGPYDAAVSTTALHWLGNDQLVRLYATLGEVVRPGGIFLDGDRLDFDHDQAAIAAGAREIRPEWPDAPEGTEDYDTWWEAAVAEPALQDEVAERARREHTHPHDHEAHSYEFHRSALFAAGFTEVGTLWQRLANRVLIALR
ncbi:MAG: class I SAM-dependent methyltransferase [Candidatus Dormiibacterota bacterium]